MAAPLRPSQPPDGCNTHAAKRARTSPGVDAPPGQETLDATWVLYNQDEASVWPELQEGPFMGSRLVSPDDQCIYGMVSTEISRMPFAVVACTRTPWPLNGPVGYRLHQRGGYWSPCVRAAYSLVEEPFPKLQESERSKHSLMDFVDCGASFVLHALLNLHTYIGYQVTFYEAHGGLCFPGLADRREYLLFQSRSRSAVEEEVKSALSHS